MISVLRSLHLLDAIKLRQTELEKKRVNALRFLAAEELAGYQPIIPLGNLRREEDL
jgi:hypothetical protein